MEDKGPIRMQQHALWWHCERSIDSITGVLEISLLIVYYAFSFPFCFEVLVRRVFAGRGLHCMISPHIRKGIFCSIRKEVHERTSSAFCCDIGMIEPVYVASTSYC